MNTQYRITTLIPAVIAVTLATSGIAQATEERSKDGQKTDQAMPSTTASLSEGEIRKIDKDGKKITIKHGEIKNLDMPPMTMVFQVKDVALLDKFQSGDKVKFRAEKTDTGFVVIDIQTGK